MIILGVLLVGNNTPRAKAMSQTALERLALRYARSLGDTTPTAIWTVRSDRQAAVSVTNGDRVDSDQNVDVILEEGTFVYSNIGPPSINGPSPTITQKYAYLIVDPATGIVTDSGFLHNKPDIGTLGTVQTVQQSAG